MAQVSTCENPEFPTWMWRYNRNKRLSRAEPWFTRAERWYPRYRNMGVRDDFPFNPEQASQASQGGKALNINYAHDLVSGRVAGFGNSALGHTPGPAPPRLIVRGVDPRLRDDLYRVNELYRISAGMSMNDYTQLHDAVLNDTATKSIDPRQYLEETLGQAQEYPGTFPHFPQPKATNEVCYAKTCPAGGLSNPMERWLGEYRDRTKMIALEEGLRSLGTHGQPIYRQPCQFGGGRNIDYEGMRPSPGAGPDTATSCRKLY